MIEDSKDGDWIRGAERRAKDKAFEQRKLQRLEAEERPNIHENTQANRRDERSNECKSENATEVAEKIILLELVARVENDRWKKKVEE